MLHRMGGSVVAMALVAGFASDAVGLSLDFEASVTNLVGTPPPGLDVGDLITGRFEFDSSITGAPNGSGFTYFDPAGTLELNVAGYQITSSLDGLRLSQFTNDIGSTLIVSADIGTSPQLGPMQANANFQLRRVFDPNGDTSLPDDPADVFAPAALSQGGFRDINPADPENFVTFGGNFVITRIVGVNPTPVIPTPAAAGLGLMLTTLAALRRRTR